MIKSKWTEETITSYLHGDVITYQLIYLLGTKKALVFIK